MVVSLLKEGSDEDSDEGSVSLLEDNEGRLLDASLEGCDKAHDERTATTLTNRQTGRLGFVDLDILECNPRILAIEGPVVACDGSRAHA